MPNPYSSPKRPPQDSTQSPWAPLQTPMFRAFWFASLASNFGTWIHEVGAGWLMAELDPRPEMVSAVRTSMALPIVFLAIPAGVLADRIDRRRLLLFTQFALLCTTAILAALTLFGLMTSWMLLVFTFVMGLGLVLHVPAWQATIPDLVPRSQLPRAVALGSVSFNLARTAGPAVGGVIIAFAGVWVAFAVNAVSFAGVIFVLSMWQREKSESSRGLSFGLSLYQGVRFVFRNRIMGNIMIGVALFIVPASALWALLPLVAKQRLAWGADGLGTLVACVGAGALVGAQFLHALQQRFGRDRTVALSMTLFASGLAMMGQSDTRWIVAASAVVMGGGWMMTLTTLNASAQVTLPRRMRARGMAFYLTVIAFSMSSGSLIWGQVAGSLGVANAQKIAAVTIVATAAVSLLFSIDQSQRSETGSTNG